MALPLLPAEVVAAAEHQEETEDGEEDDAVSCHHQATGSPFDLFKNRRRVSAGNESCEESWITLCAGYENRDWRGSFKAAFLNHSGLRSAI